MVILELSDKKIEVEIVCIITKILVFLTGRINIGTNDFRRRGPLRKKAKLNREKSSRKLSGIFSKRSMHLMHPQDS